MKKYCIPPGEKGSINDLCKIFLTEPDEVIFEVYNNKSKVYLNIIPCLEKHIDLEIAL